MLNPLREGTAGRGVAAGPGPGMLCFLATFKDYSKLPTSCPVPDLSLQDLTRTTKMLSVPCPVRY
jgi:hypothetical protein